MGIANEVGISSEIENEYPRDLLQRFMAGNHFPTEFIPKTEYTEEEEEEEEIELNLGLSLGGCFGVDPSEKKKLIRSSSSIAGLKNLLKDDEDKSLMRTSSLPVPKEDERRKRKELLSLRRLEAKRKRSEKQRNCMLLGKDRAFKEGNCEQNKQQQHKQNMALNGFSSSIPTSFRAPNWASSPTGVTNLGRKIDVNGVTPVGFKSFPPPLSQSTASTGSRGSSSSGGSDEIHGQPIQGLNNCSETRSPVSVQSMQDLNEEMPIILPILTTTTTENSSTMTVLKLENQSNNPTKVTDNSSKETGMKMMEEMPCVFTKGNGPNGKRIEGFLYKYRKGEEVRIVCVCHGSFLTPAEFVKHAGGGDVTHPLRHITVGVSSSSF